MEEVEMFIDDLEGETKKVASRLHHLILSYPKTRAQIRFKIPFYFQKSWLCYLNPIKTGGIELAFTRANELSNEQNILDFKNRKQVASISYKTLKAIDDQALNEVLNEALILDETVPYTTKRKGKSS